MSAQRSVDLAGLGLPQLCNLPGGGLDPERVALLARSLFVQQGIYGIVAFQPFQFNL